jgi:hypothetical protein
MRRGYALRFTIYGRHRGNDVQISFDIRDTEELTILSAAVSAIVMRRVAFIDALKESPAPSSEVIAEAIEGASTAAPVESTDTLNVPQSTDTLTPAEVSAADAVAAVTKATRRGMPMPAIVEYVSKAGKKVPEMTPAERAAFVAWLDAWKPGA